LSGYLIVKIYGIKPSEGFERRKYLLRRAGRIYPLWIVFFLFGILESVITGIGPWAEGQKNVSGSIPFFHIPIVVFLLTVTFTLFLDPGLWNAIIPGGWSIQAEVMHYLIYGYVRKLKLITIINVLSLGIIALQLVHLISNRTSENNFVLDLLNRINLGSTLFFFCLGGVLFVATEGRDVYRSEFLELRRAKLSTTLMFTASVLVLVSSTTFGTNLKAFAFLLFSILIAKFFAAFLGFANLSYNIAKTSYFAYFAHFQILWLLNSISKHTNILSFLKNGISHINQELFILLVWLTVTLICTLVGKISMKYLEEPSQKFFRRFE
jgi:hypothetical protein